MDNVEQLDVGLNHPAQGLRAQLGELLHRERVSQQKEGVDVARRLMLSKLQLHAVETGQAERFHHERRYILAVKSYVSYLNLDHDQETSELLKKVEALSEGGGGASPAAGVAQLHINSAIPARPRSYAARRPRLIPIVVGLLIVGAIALAISEGWPFGNGEEQVTTLQTAQPLIPGSSTSATPKKTEASTTKVTEQILAAPSAAAATTTSATAVSGPKASTISTPTAVSGASSASIAASQDAPALAASPGMPSGSTQSAGATAQLPLTPASVAKTLQPAVSSGPTMMRIDFNADCWVSLQTADGKKEERIYKQGQHVEVLASSVTALVLGNAAAAQMTLGDREIDLMAKNLTQGSITRIDQKSLQALQKN